MKQFRLHRHFFEKLGVRLGYKSMDDWYDLTTEEVINYGGESMLKNHYGTSIYRALRFVYPSHYWMPYKFKKAPSGAIQSALFDTEHRKILFDWLGEQLNVNCLDDWYRVSMEQVSKILGPHLNA